MKKNTKKLIDQPISDSSSGSDQLFTIQDEPYSICEGNTIKFKNKKRYRLKKKKNIKKKVYRNSFWNIQENMFYRQFLIDRSDICRANKFTRKSRKVNIQMSNYIKTRSAEQCRSHHQKMLKFHENIDKIITYIQEQMKVHLNQKLKEKEKAIEQAQLVIIKQQEIVVKLEAGCQQMVAIKAQASNSIYSNQFAKQIKKQESSETIYRYW